jgi:hypothetical protein
MKLLALLCMSVTAINIIGSSRYVNECQIAIRRIVESGNSIQIMLRVTAINV